MEKEESYEDGKKDGTKEYIITLVGKLKHKGKTTDEIAEILDEPIEKIQKICEVAEKYVPDYDVQKIYQKLENSEYKNEEWNKHKSSENVWNIFWAFSMLRYEKRLTEYFLISYFR